MNYYSGLLIGLLLISSSLFYGLALTNHDHKYLSISSKLDGSWRLMEIRRVAADGTVLEQHNAAGLSAIKVMNHPYFSTVFRDAEGRLEASAGRFLLQGKQYQEWIELGPEITSNTEQSYHAELDSGTWRQRTLDKDVMTEYVWQAMAEPESSVTQP